MKRSKTNERKRNRERHQQRRKSQRVRKLQLAIGSVTHGHTHDSIDVTVGATRVVCNPYGYEGYETNSAFHDGLRLEVSNGP